MFMENILVNKQNIIETSKISNKIKNVKLININSPQKAMKFIDEYLNLPQKQELLILLLDVKLKLLNYIYVSSKANFKSIIKKLYCLKAYGIICCYHKDETVDRIIENFEIVGLKLLDNFCILENSIIKSKISNQQQKLIVINKKKLDLQVFKINFELDLYIKQKLEKLFLNTLYMQERIIKELILLTSFLGQEILGIILIDKNNIIFKIELIFKGGLSSSIVDLRVLLKYLLEPKLKKIFLFHNHPSGDPKASQEDLEITHKIIQCCKILKIEFIDHIVLGKSGFESIRNLLNALK